MAHPKRKISKSRRDKRRTHYKAEASPIFVDPTTGSVHLPHRAFTIDGSTYYRGKVIIEKAQ
jgi:large subunit ribosomal protein L32